jgi:hypothetical protein
MSSSISNDLGGIVVNQNQKPGASDWVLPVGWAFQEFYLPTTYVRGAGDERRVPELSGFGILLATTSLDISVEWSLEYLVFGIGWIQVASGVETQAPHIGNRIWTNIFFDDPVDVPEEALENRWHIGLKITSGVSKVWFSRPNPLAVPHNARANGPDGFNALGSPAYSFLFRILALTADEGIDYLGNAYRSTVLFDKPGNASTIDGDRDKFWLSKPNPSRFAVENLYYDLRPAPTVPTYGRPNKIRNPSFEVSLLRWTDNATGTNPGHMSRYTGWATNGAYSAAWTGTSAAGTTSPGFQSELIPVKSGHTYSCRLDAKVVTLPTGSSGFKLLLRFWDVGGIAIGDSASDVASGSVDELVVTGVAPAGAVNVCVIAFSTSTAASSVEFYIDSVLLTEGTPIPYFDGNTAHHTWSGASHDSVSWEVVDPLPNDSVAVIDRVLVDPLTPGIFFSIYYTSEGEPGKTPEEWDQKLWTRVPQTFHAIKREAHVLPEPIQTKYVKLEFTHLQARSYSPGNFAKPITYQKHPKWVLDYFLARTESQREATSALDVGRVAIKFDAYDLAYNYYLDDLGQRTNTPFEIDPRFRGIVSNYLSSVDDLSDRLDPIMLDKIKVALTPYRSQISSFANPDTLLGGITTAVNVNSSDYPVERDTVSYADSQQLRNTAVIFENNYPVMFFYLTCRHAYRTIKATFDNDKAYFAGIKQVAFTRENYTVAFDTQVYIEPHGDLLNTERNDFAQVEGSLVV